MEGPLRVLAWNLGHRVNERVIPDAVPDVLARLDVDVALLNEFVDGPTRQPFREQLTVRGYVHQLVSFTPAKHNQVFAASRTPISLGDLAPPSMDGSAISNFLHLCVKGTDIEMVGLRVPAYETATERTEYRAELIETLLAAESRAIAFAGDFNEDPFTRS
jgi:endonuclease/exonuclease/phosphatase family metal-dependent hydrolase